MLELFINGTNGFMPTKDHHLCSIALRYNGKIAILDCGEGTQVAFSKSKWSYKSIDLIYISHGHADHLLGLPGLLLSMHNCGRTEKVTILGSAYVKKHINAAINMIGDIFNFPLEFIPIDEPTITAFFWNDLQLSFIKLRHYPQCYGIKFITCRKPKFNTEKAMKNNVPMKIWNSLLKNNSITYDGRKYTVEEISDPDGKTPIVFCYIPDTMYCLNKINNFIKGSDLTIMECMYPNKNSLANQNDKLHMCYEDVRNFGESTDRLGLIHFSPAVSRKNYHLTSPYHFLCKDSKFITLNFKD